MCLAKAQSRDIDPKLATPPALQKPIPGNRPLFGSPDSWQGSVQNSSTISLKDWYFWVGQSDSIWATMEQANFPRWRRTHFSRAVENTNSFSKQLRELWAFCLSVYNFFPTISSFIKSQKRVLRESTHWPPLVLKWWANPDFCRKTITIYCLPTAHLWLWTLWTLHLSSQVSSLTSQVSQVRAFAADFFRLVLQARADFFWCLLRPANRQKNESGTKESKAHGPYRSRAGKTGEP